MQLSSATVLLSVFVVCLYAQAQGAAIKAAEDKNEELQDEREAAAIEAKLRNYVNQMREREQLALLQSLRERAILAAVDPREYYENVDNSQVQNIVPDARQLNKRAQTFVRFGKRAQTFVRFG